MTAAAGMYAKRVPWDGHEGPRPRVVIGPGVIALETKDLARAERTYERALLGRQQLVKMWAAYRRERGEFPPDPAPTREVREWSAKSRARMVRRLAELDYRPILDSGRLPGMVTLTYPGAWEVVAPTGRAVKRHMKAFRKRYQRAWGHPLTCVWKLEFQDRGAPHIHMYTAPPYGVSPLTGQPFKQWLSATWAAIVAHPDPEQRRRHQLAGTAVDYAEGMRSSDPRRLAVYFTKHGTYRAKEYQHQVPVAWQVPGKGPGRFWGYWGLRRAVAAVEVTPGDWATLARTLRRYARSQGVTREVRQGRKRPVRRRVVRFGNGRGFLCVNNGPALAATLARLVPP